MIANKHFRTAAAFAIAALALSGCSQDRSKGLCPSASLLANTSVLSVFKANMEGDPAGVLYTVEVTGVSTNCDFDMSEGTTDSSLVVSFRATRAPIGIAAEYTVPYYVAVMRESDTVVSKQVVSATFSFRPGEAATTFIDTVPSIMVRLDNAKKPYDYSLLAGLQLTQAQLDYNKKMGRFAP